MQRIIESTKELKKLNSLTGTAILTALKAVVAEFTIAVSNILEIGFSNIIVGATAMYYGPVLTGLAGIMADTIEYLLRPSGPYFPGFALNEFVIGFIYGCFFYKKTVTLKRVICAEFLVFLIVNMGMTPLWLHMLYGNGFIALFTARIATQLIKLPINIALLYFLLTTLQRIKKPN
ncbi:MAG: folate family ECF transporter S component [Firmicutes bacterium]|nr:folate family ECF transporter S component [Bacillota bacterium]